MSGNALIKVRSEIRGERVLRRSQTDMTEVEADPVHQQIRKLFLLLRGEITVPDAVIQLRLFLDALQKRNDSGTKLVEERVAGLHVKAFFIYVQPVIVRILVRLDVSREFLVRIEYLLKIRTE